MTNSSAGVDRRRAIRHIFLCRLPPPTRPIQRKFSKPGGRGPEKHRDHLSRPCWRRAERGCSSNPSGTQARPLVARQTITAQVRRGDVELRRSTPPSAPSFGRDVVVFLLVRTCSAGHVQEARPGLGVRGTQQRVFPQTMDAQTHGVVHHVVLVRHLLKHAVHCGADKMAKLSQFIKKKFFFNNL